jgi:hypothetical protein
MPDTEPEVLDPAALPDEVDDFDACEDLDPDAPAGIVGLVGPGQRPITGILAAFQKWGVKYRVISGWQTRGRPPSSGPFNPQGLLVHHTGSTSSAANPAGALGIVTNGRSDLPGPLCQISTGFDGVTTVVAAGRANHAGRMRAMGRVPAGDGNAQLVGNEVQTNGTQQMPKVQYDAVVLSSAAVLDMLGVTVAELGLHNTTSLEGKWDLGAGNGKSGVPYSITKFRADVAARLAAGPNPSKEDDMPTPKELWDYKEINPVNGKPGAVGDMLRTTMKDTFYSRAEQAKNHAETMGMLRAIAKGKGLTQAELDAVKAAAEAGTKAALAESVVVQGDVTVTQTSKGA